MALVNCPECSKEISDSSVSCPHCGYPLNKEKPVQNVPSKNQKPKYNSKGIGCLVIIIGILIIYAVTSISSYFEEKNKPPKTEKEIRKELVEKHFSSWDGSHIGLTALIKKTMNDPSSYEHVETTYSDNASYLIVKTTFRGKNAFGGTVTNWIRAKVDLSGNITEVISQGP